MIPQGDSSAHTSKRPCPRPADLRARALLAAHEDPVSRRALAQMCGLADDDREGLDLVLRRLASADLARDVGDGHWVCPDRKRLAVDLSAVVHGRPHAFGEQSDADDPVVRALVPPPETGELEHARLVLDLLRDLGRRGHCAAVLVCIDLLFRLAASLTARALPDGESRELVTLVVRVQSLSNMFAYRQEDAESLLDPARRTARRLGDERSQLMLDLMEGCLIHLSHLHNLSSPHILLRSVMERVRTLGDTDILTSTSTGVGLVHFMQGEYEKAIACFKKCPPGFFFDRFDYLEEVRLRYIGSAACALGRLDLGVAPMLASLHEAGTRGYHFTVKWHKVHLSDQLLRVGMLEEGIALLTEVIHCTDAESELKLWLWALRNLAYYHFQYGRVETAHHILSGSMREVLRLGGRRPYYGFTWIFDMLGTFRRMGLPDVPGYPYAGEIDAGLASPNPLFRAAALRVHVDTMRALGQPVADEEKKLRQSLALAEEVHGVLEIARSRLALSRFLDAAGRNPEEAATLRERARLVLGRFHQYDCPPPPNGKGRASGTGGEEDFPRVPDKTACRTRLAEGVGALTSSESAEDAYRILMEALCSAFELERAVLLPSWSGTGDCPTPVASLHIPPDEFDRSLRASVERLAATEGTRCARLRDDRGSFLVLKLPGGAEDGGDLLFVAHCTYLHDSVLLQDPALFQRLAETAAAELHKALLWQSRLRTRETTTLERARLATEQARPDEFFYGGTMEPLLRQADTVAASDASVLILGETGVGKEILARRIHAHSGRKGLFVAVNPAGLTEQLFESECFGHEKGAFTGAHKQKIGLFELADGGTLFIDELGEIPLSLQVKLLRALQEKAFLRVGGTREIHSDFRLVTATNKDLRKMVEEGRFREDLYYRVAVIPISLPPLRERKEDVAVLADIFARQFATRYQRPVRGLDRESLERLCRYPWPGNIRELRSVVERAVILSVDGQVRFDSLRGPSHGDPGRNAADTGDRFFADLPTLEELERRYIDHVLVRTRGKVDGPDGALRILGMKRSTLYNRMRAYGLDKATRAYGASRGGSDGEDRE